MAATVLAPGARVEIRSAEWIVRRVDATSTGGYSLLVTGVSEIVRDKEARFLTEIEGKGIKVLDPAETELVPDDSPQFRKAKLYLESLLRQSPPTDTDLWIGHRAASRRPAFPTRPCSAGARPTAATHSHGGFDRPRQDSRSRHPAERTHQPRHAESAFWSSR